MAIDFQALIDAVVSHGKTLGCFDSVNGHDLKRSPGTGLHMAVGLGAVGPAVGGSGLRATSAHVVIEARIYGAAETQPPGALHPMTAHAVDLLFTALLADFTLGDLVKAIDVRGMAGGGTLRGEPSYVQFGEGGGWYRVYDVHIPVVINDAWPEVP